ncbi:hypothetical protein BD324DRAFT_464958 [Kockovaella imperatae]|uniref:BZIP domain-containing protein n=1 Tax=Kockovaella imperatae TaxID=4999 RepID=A0A1Y1UI26_9TREE|nr:hypothetical protein BD324DRAFT_464958 [Kockovaella imperatae]ORX36745.1 hypothetical protein BD324DRAFT_464958 [Kockovaella imperatae]
MTKAQRRKEQNRAAQKAFRERREAKVRDLEEKVAELESKSYGVNVENENLRGILKRLQEENVALKQAAFTFSMPVASGSAAPAQSSSSGKEASLGTTRQPSPYQAEDPLRSINDPPARNDSLGSNASPEPLRSVNSPNLRAANASTDRSPSQPPQLFNGATNAFDSNFLSSYMGKPGSPSNSMKTSPPSVPASSQSGLTPQSTTSTKTEIEALWASFLDQQAQQRQQAQQPKTPGTLLKEQAYSMFGNGAFTGNGFVTSPKAFDAGNAGTGAAPSFDKMAFRDDSSGSAKSQPQAPVSVPAPQDGNRDPWAGMMDSSMKDFLASLTGANEESAEVPPTKSPEDEDFNAQLLKLLGAASPSAAFNLPVGTDNPFSPTNYLNMEPSPSASGSNGISPASMAQLSSVSNSASPGSSAGDAATSVTSFSQSQNGDGSHGLSAQKRQDSDGKEWVYIVDQSGNVIRPADMWTDLGFKKQDAMHEILVDDLCDLMKTKVTCKDGE